MHFIQRSISITSTLHQNKKKQNSSRMPPPRPETTLYSYCRSGEPVLTKFWFDGTRDCRDGSDELPEDVKDEMMDKEKKDEMMDKEGKDVVLMSESKVERLIDDRFNRLVLELEKKPANPLDLNSYEDVLKRVVDSSPKKLDEDKSSWAKELGVYLVEWILPPLNSSGLLSAILGLLYYRRRRRTQAAKSKKSEEKTTNTEAPPIPPRPPQGDLMA